MFQVAGYDVIAFVEDVAASGGYWLACAADEIFVDPSSIVGSRFGMPARIALLRLNTGAVALTLISSSR